MTSPVLTRPPNLPVIPGVTMDSPTALPGIAERIAGIGRKATNIAYIAGHDASGHPIKAKYPPGLNLAILERPLERLTESLAEID